jgi:hypothetical protein
LPNWITKLNCQTELPTLLNYRTELPTLLNCQREQNLPNQISIATLNCRLNCQTQLLNYIAKPNF